jgi:hypothetical protein
MMDSFEIPALVCSLVVADGDEAWNSLITNDFLVLGLSK